MNKKVTFAQLKGLLEKMGFAYSAHPTHYLFEHPASNTVFLFRTYRATNPVSAGNLATVRRMLDERGLMDVKRFDKLWKKPATPETPKKSRS